MLIFEEYFPSAYFLSDECLKMSTLLCPCSMHRGLNKIDYAFLSYLEI